MQDEQDPGQEQRWRALTLGSLPEDEAAELRAKDPERYELRRPFTPDERRRLLTRVRRTLDRKEAEEPSRAPWWRRSWAPIGSTGLAFAAAMALVTRSALAPAVEVAWSQPRGGEVRPPHVSSAADASPDEKKLNEAIVSTHPGRGVVVRGALLARPWSTEPGRFRAL